MNICQGCNTNFVAKDSRTRFCGRSCSATHNNRLAGRRKPRATAQCLNCGDVIAGRGRKYCSPRCCGDFRLKEHLAKMMTGEIQSGVRPLRRYIIKRDGHRCGICGTSEWQEVAVPLVMDHKDGNSENNDFLNLRMLCPNCDALLPTYKSRNRGHGRHSRRERYHAGKSY